MIVVMIVIYGSHLLYGYMLKLFLGSLYFLVRILHSYWDAISYRRNAPIKYIHELRNVTLT